MWPSARTRRCMSTVSAAPAGAMPPPWRCTRRAWAEWARGGRATRWRAGGVGGLWGLMVGIQGRGGRKRKIRAGDLLGALTGELGFRREQIGKIDVNDFSTYVAVERAIGAQAAQ